ncbi:thioredoxin-like domain-containing protein [Mariniphaga sp.]|uniref:thioredoxin-like domain-containing protein n=1 Tax=Mariniphaga sp. TaxID=1954475 RepID=UPI003563C3A6
MKAHGIRLSFVFMFFHSFVFAQAYSLNVRIKNQPENPVVLGTISGDKFSPVDTLELQQVAESLSGGNNLGSQGSIQQVTSSHQLKQVNWNFSENAKPGMYRLIFGQTAYARVMGESPQQLDFIFNNENIVLETDFKAPQNSLIVLQSEENSAWFNFLKKEKELQNHLDLLEKEVDYFQTRITAAKSSPETVAKSDLQEFEKQAVEKANTFNQLQMERDRFILNTAEKNKELLASRFISIFREPLRDGYLSQQERKEFYQKEYLRHIDFTDESLIHSPVLTDKIFDFLVTYNQRGFSQEQREQEYMKAVDAVMSRIETVNPASEINNPVYEFILNYLVFGFERLNMGKLLTYIAENYSGSLCQTDEKTTLERKLEFQNMKPGNLVSDFTINDLRDEPTTLSHILKPRNLILFYASWCSHCKEILPQIKAWRRQFQATELEIIAISLDTSKSDWQQIVRETRFEEFFNLSELKGWDGEVAPKYNVYATPTMFIVDDNLRILAKPESMGELMKYFEQ